MSEQCFFTRASASVVLPVPPPLLRRPRSILLSDHGDVSSFLRLRTSKWFPILERCRFVKVIYIIYARQSCWCQCMDAACKSVDPGHVREITTGA